MGGPVRERFWPGNLMALGIFVVLVSFWWAGMRTLITFMLLSKVFAALAFAGNLIPYAWSGARLGMERFEWFLFNLLAVGPLVFSALLWINYFVTGPDRHYMLMSGGSNVDIHQYWIEHAELPENEPFDPAAMDAATAERFVAVQGERSVFTLARGCLGYDVIKTYTYVDVEGMPSDH